MITTSGRHHEHKPHGNVTGLSAMVDDLYAKRLELLNKPGSLPS